MKVTTWTEGVFLGFGLTCRRGFVTLKCAVALLASLIAIVANSLNGAVVVNASPASEPDSRLSSEGIHCGDVGSAMPAENHVRGFELGGVSEQAQRFFKPAENPVKHSHLPTVTQSATALEHAGNRRQRVNRGLPLPGQENT